MSSSMRLIAIFLGAAAAIGAGDPVTTPKSSTTAGLTDTADNGNNHFNVIVYPEQSASDDTLTIGLNAPNATGRYPISGPNITNAYPSTMMDGWELEMDVAANLPIANGDATAKFVSAAGFKLIPPPELVENGVVNADRDSWYGCMNIFGADGIPGYTGDGTCSGLLTSKCIANVKKAIANAPKIRDGTGCALLWNITNAKDSECPFQNEEYAASFDFRDDFLVGHEMVLESKTMDSASDLSAYRKFGTTTYPVIITWGHNGTTSGALPENHVTVACARANVTTPGSQTATGSGLHVGLSSMALAAVAIVFAVLF